MESNNNKKLVELGDRVKQVGGTLIIKEAKVIIDHWLISFLEHHGHFCSQVEDSGKYLCMVNNTVGGESVETVLTVTGKEESDLPSRLWTCEQKFLWTDALRKR